MRGRVRQIISVMKQIVSLERGFRACHSVIKWHEIVTVCH